MQTTAPAVTALIEEFAKLPGIGPKTAQRLTFFLLRSPADQSRRLAQALVRITEQVTTCAVCFNIAESSPCTICADPARDHGVICVVEEPLDLLAIEKTGVFHGVYHVLGGALSPVDGVGPKDLRIAELEHRAQNGETREVILATNPNFAGDYTATFIAQALRPGTVTLTRLARGLPLGGDLEYADEATLSRALEGRRAFEG